MSWNYRVMSRNDELSIYEVYYREDGTVEGYSAVPTFPAAGTLEELRENCRQYMSALDKPVLRFEE